MVGRRGDLLILSGPHGAGKDSVEKRLRDERSDIERIVRHITREPSNIEKDGVDYHFVSRDRMEEMILDGEMLEYATYPDVISGTSRDAVASVLERTPYGTITLNVEDALPLQGQLREQDISSRSFFVSPVDEEVLIRDEKAYLDSLRERMERRGRPDDRIANKLAKAALYREVYLNNQQEFTYIANVTSQLDVAVGSIISELDRSN
jgi:guanylate kinase